MKLLLDNLNGLNLFIYSATAWFVIFAISAPVQFAVTVDNCVKFSSYFFLKSECNFILLRYNLNKSFLSCIFGLSKIIFLSNLPDLNKAGSKTLIILDAAIISISSVSENPSISTSKLLRVDPCSLCPPNPPPVLFLPIASISSINIIDGEFFLAKLNNSLILFAPTPTYISIKSEPLTEINDDLVSPANAFANSVLPVPGGPDRSNPLGILKPALIYSFLCFI